VTDHPRRPRPGPQNAPERAIRAARAQRSAATGRHDRIPDTNGTALKLAGSASGAPTSRASGYALRSALRAFAPRAAAYPTRRLAFTPITTGGVNSQPALRGQFSTGLDTPSPARPSSLSGTATTAPWPAATAGSTAAPTAPNNTPRNPRHARSDPHALPAARRTTPPEAAEQARPHRKTQPGQTSSQASPNRLKPTGRSRDYFSGLLGSRFRLGLPPHPASRRRSCLWLVVGAINLHRGLAPPSCWSCRAHTVHAVLPHTALRRSSPAVFSVPDATAGGVVARRWFPRG
jgi:hypothetical protein